MSCSEELNRKEVPAKGSGEIVPVDFDWHDVLANKPARGKAYGLTTHVRLPRAQATGFQYECTTAGVTGNVEPRWPKVLTATVSDGSVVWTARAMASTSLRTTISSVDNPEHDDLDISSPSVEDLIYRYQVGGGSDGETYELTQHIICANAEEYDATVALPVED